MLPAKVYGIVENVINEHKKRVYCLFEYTLIIIKLLHLVRMELDLVESQAVTGSVDLHGSGCNVEFYRYSTV